MRLRDDVDYIRKKLEKNTATIAGISAAVGILINLVINFIFKN
jgi:hypothetical protein